MLQPAGLFRLSLYAACCALLAYGGYLAWLDESRLPPLKDGDLLFQTTLADGSAAIALASGSWYIHTGIVRLGPDGPQVIHAGRVVEAVPLSQWIRQGVLSRVAVYRHKALSPQQAQRVLAAAGRYAGRPYDHYFSFDNEAIYCSELEYLAFKEAGVPLGKVEKIGALPINNRFARKLIEQRWQHYPACEGKGYSFDQCYRVIMDGELVTPASIARDSRVERIFTNYPW